MLIVCDVYHYFWKDADWKLPRIAEDLLEFSLDEDAQ